MRIFTSTQINLAAILAGPMPPGFMMFWNFKKLGKLREAYTVLCLTLVFSVLLAYFLLKIPEEVLDKIPNMAFTSFYAIIIALVFYFMMHKQVKKAIEEGATRYSNWKVLGISLAGLLLYFAMILAMAMQEPLVRATPMLQVNANELYYDAEVPEYKVQLLSKELQEFGFFMPDYQNVAHLQLEGLHYVVVLYVDEEFWSDAELIASLQQFRNRSAVLLNDMDLKLRLLAIKLDGTTKTFNVR